MDQRPPSAPFLDRISHQDLPMDPSTASSAITLGRSFLPFARGGRQYGTTNAGTSAIIGVSSCSISHIWYHEAPGKFFNIRGVNCGRFCDWLTGVSRGSGLTIPGSRILELMRCIARLARNKCACWRDASTALRRTKCRSGVDHRNLQTGMFVVQSS